MMPTNASGTPIEPSDYNWSDGFSPGAPIVTKVPGLDTPAALARTGAVPVTDLARSFDSKQPILVINARTLQPPADLGRAGLERLDPGQHRAPDPPGQEPA